MATITPARVIRDRKAESQADMTMSLAKRFGSQVPAAKLAEALKTIGWREGANAVNRANDPNCGMWIGWQTSEREKALGRIEKTLGRHLLLDELNAFDGGYFGAINGSN